MSVLVIKIKIEMVIWKFCGGNTLSDDYNKVSFFNLIIWKEKEIKNIFQLEESGDNTQAAVKLRLSSLELSV